MPSVYSPTLQGKLLKTKDNTIALSVLLITICCISLVGCGGTPQGTISGNVTLDDAPLESALITLVKPADGMPVGSTTVTNGAFAFSEPVPAGSYAVTIGPPEEEAPAGTDDAARAAKLQTVPNKYWSYQTSGLTAEVQEGESPAQTIELSK